MLDRGVARTIIEEQVKAINPVLKERYGWEIEIRDLSVFVEMRSFKDDEKYMVRIQCDNYPNVVIQFVNPSTRNPEPNAWPIDQPSEGPSVFGDMNFTFCRPGPGQWTIGEMIHRIQFYLNYEGYKGRRPG